MQVIFYAGYDMQFDIKYMLISTFYNLLISDILRVK
jgi:hypothetical protein